MPATARRSTGRFLRAAALAAALAVLGAGPAAATEEESFTEEMTAPVGALVSFSAHRWYGEEPHSEDGTNPKITEATFSTTEYYSVHEIRNGILWVEVKTADELNALSSPPPNPFEVEVDVTATNDEELEKTGTVTFETRYLRTATTPLPSDGEQPSEGEDG